jgi:4-diphosphocytidyl-2-C-methyl-D-erythritol kinase
MIVFPNAKINLGLRILRKRPDGYHDLESAFLPIGLTDILETVPAGSGPEVRRDMLSLTGIPLEARDDNLCMQAIRLLRKRHGIPYVKLHLHKRIPAGAGLGGGSADAAFTLLALNELFSLRLDVPVLLEYASGLGSDCPFFIINEPCLATGRGDRLETLHIDLSGYTLLLVMPGISMDTGKAYQMVRPTAKGQSIKMVIKLDPKDWNGRLANHFEGPVFGEYPEIGEIKQVLYDAGAVFASMTGSGTAVFGLFAERPVIPPELSRYPLYVEGI